jgi:hypothetical protein
MSNQQENRVLSRQSARELNKNEVEHVNGAIRAIGKCTFDPRTCVMDGQCSPPPAC